MVPYLRDQKGTMSEPLFNIKIQGRPMVKKNKHKIFARGNKRWISPSNIYINWENDLVGRLLLRSKERIPIDFPVYMEATMYLKNHKWEPDTTNSFEGFQDVMQKAGIIKNDKLIYKALTEKVFNSEEEYFTVSLFKL